MANVPAHYLLYLYDNGGVSHAGVRQYINDNLEALKTEAGRNRRQ